MSTAETQYAAGVTLATLSFITLLLTIPPMTLHFRNRNTAAAALIAWLSILLLFNFVNAILWPADNWNTWYNGVGLCDVEVKVQIGAQVALPSCLACILRRLAGVLDPERQVVGETRKQKRRGLWVDLGFCVGFPVLQMCFHLIVQSYRYDIFGTYGCVPYVGGSWVSFVLIIVPPAIWVGLDVYFAVLILIRLYRYRASISSVLETSNTTRSRFVRLYLLCLTFIIVSVPLEIYIIFQNAVQKWHAFSWSKTHSAEMWKSIIETQSKAHTLYDRWVVLAFGILVFAFFGFGQEAMSLYRSALLALRLDKLFPRLNPANRIAETSKKWSFGKKAKELLKHKSSASISTSRTSDVRENFSSKADSPQPQQMAHLATIPERINELETIIIHDATHHPVRDDIEKMAETAHKLSLVSRISSVEDSRQWNEAFNTPELSGDPKPVGSQFMGEEGREQRSLEVI